MTERNMLTAQLAALLFVVGVVFGVAAAATAHPTTHFHKGTAHAIVADTTYTGHNSYLTACGHFPTLGWVRTEWHNHYTRNYPGGSWVYSHDAVAGYVRCW